MVKLYSHLDEYATSIQKVCSTVLEMFSPETFPDPKDVEAVIRTTSPSASVIFK